MKYKKPDGVIEFGGSGCCCPPGQRRPGMHTNATTSWYRVNDGEWVKMPRSSSGPRVLAEAAENCAEFVKAFRDSA